MRLIAHAFPNSEAHSRLQVKGQHMEARQAGHSIEVLDRIELTDGQLLVMITGNTSSNCSMTDKQQTTLEAFGNEWPTLTNPSPCMVQVFQFALGTFISSLGINGRTKSSGAH
jgi:hypothetical protein